MVVISRDFGLWWVESHSLNITDEPVLEERCSYGLHRIHSNSSERDRHKARGLRVRLLNIGAVNEHFPMLDVMTKITKAQSSREAI